MKKTALTILVIAFFATCSKADKVFDPVSNPVNPSTSTPKSDSIFIFNVSSLYNNDTLQATYKDTNNIEYNFYGVRNTTGNLLKVSSIVLSKLNNYDSLQNFVLDDSNRIAATYFTFNGVKDTTIIKFDYTDSLILLSKYLINWDSKLTKLRQLVTLRKDGTNFKLLSNQTFQALLANSNDDLEKISATAQVAVGGFAILAASGVILGYLACSSNPASAAFAPACGVAGGALITFIFLPKSAKAHFELPNIKTVPPLNPKNDFNKINFPPTPQVGKIDVSTKVLSNVTYNSATSGGEVSGIETSKVLDKGICWTQGKLAGIPTIGDNKISAGAGSGSFVSNLTNLWVLDYYNIRAYAKTADSVYYGKVEKLYTPHILDSSFWKGSFTHVADTFKIQHIIGPSQMIITPRHFCSVCSESKLLMGISISQCISYCGSNCCGYLNSLACYVNADGTSGWFEDGRENFLK